MSVKRVSFLFGALTLLAALAPSSYAQGIIARGGLNYSKAVTDPKPASPSSRDYLQGLNGALLGELGNGAVRLIVGAGYENRGMHVSGAGGGDIRLDYMTVPVMLSFGTPSVNIESSLFLNLGIEPAFLLSSDYAMNNFTFTFDRAEDFDLNLRAELGAELPLTYSGPAIVVGGAYTYGLTDADKSGNTWHNYAFSAFLGLKLRGM